MSDKWEQLERLAKEAVPEDARQSWTSSRFLCSAAKTEEAVWGPDGDALALVYTNLGLDIHAEHLAAYIAAANPAAILSLLSDYRSALARAEGYRQDYLKAQALAESFADRTLAAEAKLAAVPDAGLMEDAVEALRPFAHFAKQWNEKPLRGMDDKIYGIHANTQWEALLTRTMMQNALNIVSRYEATKQATGKATE